MFTGGASPPPLGGGGGSLPPRGGGGGGHACNESDPLMDIRGYPQRILAELDRGTKGQSILPCGYPSYFISARSAADIGGYPACKEDCHLIGHFVLWRS